MPVPQKHERTCLLLLQTLVQPVSSLESQDVFDNQTDACHHWSVNPVLFLLPGSGSNPSFVKTVLPFPPPRETGHSGGLKLLGLTQVDETLTHLNDEYAPKFPYSVLRAFYVFP